MPYQLTGDLDVNAHVGVILPTYCEAQNIAGLVTEIENLRLGTSILVIDDSSPDKTAEIAKNRRKKNRNILDSIPPQKSGLGTAIIDGFKIYLSLRNMPKRIVTMDADDSHDPKAIRLLMQTIKT